MKKTFYLVVLAACMCHVANAQKKTQFGIKAGYNWSFLTGSEEGFKPGNQTGFMASVFLSPTTKTTGLGYRTEFVFSRPGYSFDNGG